MQSHSQQQLEILRLMEVDVWRLRPDVHPAHNKNLGNSPQDFENKTGIERLAQGSPQSKAFPAVRAEEPTAMATKWSAAAEHEGSCDWMFVCQTGAGDLSPSSLAGGLYDSLLFSLGLRRSQVCTVSGWVVTAEEVPEGNLENAVKSYLSQHSSKVIMVIGGDCARTLLGSDKDTRALRSEQHRLQDYESPLLVTHGLDWMLAHPEDKAETWRDLIKAKKIVEG
ncbi:MAG: hypothetical protein WBM41_19100 [Arenicellales bacterium]